MWADPTSGLPLRVEVAAGRSGDVVVSSTFLEVSQDAAPDSVVRFQPPPGAFISRTVAPDFAQAVERYSPFLLPDNVGNRPRTTGFGAAGVYGHGFDRIATLVLPERFSPLSRDELDKLRPVKGPWDQGFLAHTPLLNGLIVENRGYVVNGTRTDDILYMLGGAVRPAALVRAARSLLRRPLPLRRGCC
jgi:hypothetical protein